MAIKKSKLDFYANNVKDGIEARTIKGSYKVKEGVAISFTEKELFIMKFLSNEPTNRNKLRSIRMISDKYKKSCRKNADLSLGFYKDDETLDESCFKRLMDKTIKMALSGVPAFTLRDYEKDENGNPVLNDKGNPNFIGEPKPYIIEMVDCSDNNLMVRLKEFTGAEDFSKIKVISIAEQEEEKRLAQIAKDAIKAEKIRLDAEKIKAANA